MVSLSLSYSPSLSLSFLFSLSLIVIFIRLSLVQLSAQLLSTIVQVSGISDKQTLLSVAHTHSSNVPFEAISWLNAVVCSSLKVTCVCWRKNTLATGSWDSTVKVILMTAGLLFFL